MASNDTRTRDNLQSRGYVYEKTEHWNSFARKRKDLLGVFDAIGLKPGRPILGVQTTARSCISARKKKILASDLARLWLECGAGIEIHGFDKHTVGQRDQWRIKIVTLTLEDFA